MALYLIGIGLGDEKDITVKGLEIVQKCEKAYLENYTSLLQSSQEKLEKLYGRKIILADRILSEQQDERIVNEAKTKNIAFLVVGDPFSATTHIQLFRLAKEKGIKVEVIHNASIFTAVGITGLQLYKFGRTASIPFVDEFPNVETPYNVFRENYCLGLHTLFLLDLKPEENKFMSVIQAVDILKGIEQKKKENFITKKLPVVGCARLGTDGQVIATGTIDSIQRVDFGRPPHCLIIPGKLHFSEQEMLNLWKP